RNHLDPRGVEDVFLGDANQAGEDNRNVARMAVLLAGLPVEVPGATFNRLCGSGLQAVISAVREIETANGELFLAGGVESMTRALHPAQAQPRLRARAADAIRQRPGMADGQPTHGGRTHPEPGSDRRGG